MSDCVLIVPVVEYGRAMVGHFTVVSSASVSTNRDVRYSVQVELWVLSLTVCVCVYRILWY